MSIEKKISKYTSAIWADQLPPEEEAFLYALLNNGGSETFLYDPESDYSLFLACSAQRNGYQGYNEEQTQAFRQLLQQNRMQKLEKIPAISKVLKALNENGIVPVLLKGAAYLCCYAPNLPRMMGDIDICIQPDQFEKAVALIYGLGFEFVLDTGYHIGVTSEKLDMDIHRYIYKNGGDIGSDIYDRLVSCTFLGSKVYVLSPEDMLVHQLVNRGRDLCVQSHLKRHFKWILDCRSVLEQHKASAASLLKKADEVNNLYYAELMLAKLIELFPERFEDQGTRLKDRNYCRFLRRMAKRVNNAEETPGETVTGLKYILSVFRNDWEVTKISKIVTGSGKTVLRMMLDRDEIHTWRDLSQRLKTAAENSRDPAGSEEQR